MSILDRLNQQQREAVLENRFPLAIIAGAGSGKTRTIAHKIAYLIKEKGVKPYRILAVTFTNKATKELKERVIALAGPIGEDVMIYTYHAFCARFLRTEISAIGYPTSYNIIDNIDQKSILKPAYKENSVSPKTLSYSSMLDYISTAKNNNQTPEQMIESAEKDVDKVMANMYKYYDDEMRRTKSLDFDDLILKTHKVLLENKDVADKWAAKYDFFLIDEFQDTSISQYEIIKMISKDVHITVVGDPDQTIYTWRNADATLIMNFHQEYNDSVIVKLEENYRSTPEILVASNNLIQNNTRRIDKKLFTSKPKGDIVEYSHSPSEYAEARWVANKITELKKNGTKLRNIAILYRSNYLTNALEKVFIDNKVNYVIYGGVKFYQREEIKDAISFLKVISSGDEVAMKRIINKPARKIGQTSQDRLEEFRQRMGEDNLYDAILKYSNSIPLKGQALEGLIKLINLVNKYKKAAESNPISLVLDKFLIEVGYHSMWSSFEDKSRIDNINELISSIQQWEKNNPEGKLQDFIDEISLYIDNDDESIKQDFVSLMTVHTSKGLEFDHVFIYGFSEGIFPSKRTIQEDGNKGLEEERRLAYVAVTRAKTNLYISSSKGFNIDHTDQKKPSRFLDEMGINFRAFTKEFIAPANVKDNFTANNNFVEGDQVFHEKFGLGIVLNVSGKIAEINFKNFGQKTLMKDHKALRLAVE